MENNNKMIKKELRFGRSMVTLYTNKPQEVEKTYKEKFGCLMKLTTGFKQVVDYIINHNKGTKIIVDSMVPIAENHAVAH